MCHFRDFERVGLPRSNVMIYYEHAAIISCYNTRTRIADWTLERISKESLTKDAKANRQDFSFYSDQRVILWILWILYQVLCVAVICELDNCCSRFEFKSDRIPQNTEREAFLLAKLKVWRFPFIFHSGESSIPFRKFGLSKFWVRTRTFGSGSKPQQLSGESQ